jgi:hypothetical protein
VQGFAGPYITTLPPSQIFWTINLLLTSSQLIKIKERKIEKTYQFLMLLCI